MQYIYISDHLIRLNNISILGERGLFLKYELKENNLIINKAFLPSFFYRLFFIRNILYYIDKQRNKITTENKYRNFILANELFLESKKLLQKQYPDIKFVILRYQTNYINDSFVEEPYMWDVLEKEGFIIIESKDLVGRLFTQNDTNKDLIHPNAKTWDIIANKLAEKLDL